MLLVPVLDLCTVDRWSEKSEPACAGCWEVKPS